MALAPGTRGRARGDRRRRRCRRLSGCPGQDQSGCRSGGAPPGLDGVSGPATGVLAATLSPHGTLVSFAAMSEGPMSINPLDVIFKPLTIRGFWLGHPEIAGKIGPAIVQAAAMIASGPVHIPVAAQWPRPTPSPRSNSLSPMRCRAEKSFWTLPDHPPDLGIEHSIWPPRSRSTASIERSMSIRLPFRPG